MIIDLFSRRQEELNGAVPEVYSYDTVPETLRVQVQQILRDSLGPHHVRTGYSGDSYINDNPDVWEFLAKGLRKEFGVHRLAHGNTEGKEVIAFLAAATPAQFIDAVELCVRILDRMGRKWSDYDRKNSLNDSHPSAQP